MFQNHNKHCFEFGLLVLSANIVSNVYFNVSDFNPQAFTRRCQGVKWLNTVAFCSFVDENSSNCKLIIVLVLFISNDEVVMD